MAFCRNCGTELSDGAKFCPSCGTPVNKSGTPVNKSETPAKKSGKRVVRKKRVQKESTELSILQKIGIFCLLVFCIFFFIEKCGDDFGSDEFSTLESCLPKNGVSYFVVKDAKTFGSIGRKLQSIVFYEKDGKRDVIIEGIEKDGSTYQNTGNWKKDIKNATYKAVDYKYFNFSYSVDEFFVDKDLNIYFASALFSPSDSDVGEAFEKGPIGKLQKCSSEEDFKNQLKKMKEDAKNNSQTEDKESRKKKIEEEAYSAGKSAKYDREILEEVQRIIRAGGTKGYDVKGTMHFHGIMDYKDKYDEPKNAEEKELMELYAQKYIEGFMTIFDD